MTWEQYWFGDPWIARDYANAYILRRRAENEKLWLEGVYFNHALASVIGTAFGKKKIKYLEAPLDIFPKTEAEKEQEKREKRNQLIQMLNAMLHRKKKE